MSKRAPHSKKPRLAATSQTSAGEMVDRELKGVAGELHNGLGQQITAIIFHAHLLHRALLQEGHARATQAAQILDLLKAARIQARLLARRLQPLGTQPEALMTALKEFAEAVSEMPGIVCEFDGQSAVSVENYEQATSLLRVTQEVVSDAIFRGAPRRLGIRLRRLRRRFELTIRETWTGESAPSLSGEPANLEDLAQRVRSLGGTLERHTIAGEGTILRCVLPAGSRAKAETTQPPQ